MALRALGWSTAAIAVPLLLIAATPKIDTNTYTLPEVVDGTGFSAAGTSLLEIAVTSDRAERWLADFDSGAEEDRLLETVVEIYRHRSFRPAWHLGSEGARESTKHTSSRRARAMLRHLTDAESLGLSPAHYPAEQLASRIKLLELDPFPQPLDLVRAEIELTGALVVLVRDLHEGHIDAEQVPNWYRERSPADLVTQVGQILDNQQGLDIAPEHEEHRALAEHAAELRQLVAEGGWPRVPDLDVLKPGDPISDEVMAPLVERLKAGGDLDSSWNPHVSFYGPTLVDAVRSFQHRHGLDVDGKIGGDTLSALNVSAEQRLQQIEANLERWRWLPEELPETRIEVNVAAFELTGFRKGEPTLRMAVAVGKPTWATPIFEHEIVYAEVNPYWNIPESIALGEVLPALRTHPSYLVEENMEIIAGWNAETPGEPLELDESNPGRYGSDYRIRQLPGPKNALGQIKFIFPNDHSVYLHDTPAQRAFGRADRAVSHGCVRLAEPAALAEFLFDKDQLEKLDAALSSSSGPERFDLREPMPVLFEYRTAFVGDDGRLHFREDLYGLDSVIAEQLASYQRAREPRVST